MHGACHLLILLVVSLFRQIELRFDLLNRGKWGKVVIAGQASNSGNCPFNGRVTVMLQVNIHAPGEFALDEVQPPQVGPADIVVDVASCGICGSDLGYVAAGGLMGPAQQPMPLGHELAGTVSAMGGGNLIGNGGTEGGFTPQLLVRNAVLDESVFILPHHISFELGALVEPLSVAAHGVNQSGAGADSKVLVLGAGPIGLATIAVLKYRGVQNIVALDLSAERLARARELGAGAAVDASQGSIADLVMPIQGSSEWFGMPVLDTDIFIDATGVKSVVEDVLNNMKTGASLVVVGLHKEDIPVSFSNILAREITIKGSMGYPTEFPEVIAMLASGTLDLSPMVSHRYPLQQFEQAFIMASNASVAAKVMVTMS
jgi:threonine dehydrogenase-like Zn-dependent dehydrogenase